jgi:sugar/nucleoside kinase (ribokinase family)
MKKYDVASICNALVDILIQVDDFDLTKLGLTKGVMHLVDSERQGVVLSQFQRHQKSHELGGSSLNAIRTLAGLGLRTYFAGMVGDDEFALQIKKRLGDLEIDYSLQSHNEPTGSCVVLISPDGERTMNTHLGASRLFDKSLVPEDAIASSKIFHFCGYQWDTEEQKETITKAIDCSIKNSTLVSFDVADPFVVKRHQKDLLDIVKKSDIVFANQEEAKILFESTPEAALGEITRHGATGVIKLGAKGALVGRGDEIHAIAPVKTTVIDTTAAGDMFAAGFLYGVSNNLPLGQCGNIAALLASDVISRIGATVSGEALERAKQLTIKR